MYNHHGKSLSDDILARLQSINEGDPGSVEARNRFLEQALNKDSPKHFPNGKSSPDDEGDLAFAVSSDPSTELIRIDYSKPVHWLAIAPQDAVKLAELLIQHARAVSKSPIVVSLS